MSDAYKNLAGLMEKMVASGVAQSVNGAFPELGVITAKGLKLDGFKYEIQDYLVAEYLTLSEPDFTETEQDGKHQHPQSTCPHGKATVSDTGSEHLHQVKTPSQLRPLKVGDRVLVIPVNHGQEFVVVARVVVANA